MHTSTPPSAHASTHWCIDTKMKHRYKSACIGRKINTKTYFEHITVHSHATQYKRDQRSTVQIQHSARQTMRNATLLYNTTHTDKHAVHYVNFVSFPYLGLPALHCIKLHDTTLRCTTLHFTALQSIALLYAALHPSVHPSIHPIYLF